MARAHSQSTQQADSYKSVMESYGRRSHTFDSLLMCTEPTLSPQPTEPHHVSLSILYTVD